MSLQIKWITIREAAKILGCCKQSILRGGAGTGSLVLHKRPGTNKFVVDERAVLKLAANMVQVTRRI